MSVSKPNEEKFTAAACKIKVFFGDRSVTRVKDVSMADGAVELEEIPSRCWKDISLKEFKKLLSQVTVT